MQMTLRVRMLPQVSVDWIPVENGPAIRRPTQVDECWATNHSMRLQVASATTEPARLAHQTQFICGELHHAKEA